MMHSCPMNRIFIFTDSSVNPQTQIGFGACLILKESEFLSLSLNEIEKKLAFKKFTSTSSTTLELQTLLWALSEIMNYYKIPEIINHLILYTDSQCIEKLLQRRNKLEKSHFISAGQNRELSHSSLYREYYGLNDQLKFQVVKVKGHSKTASKDPIHLVFSLVDKASRKKLRAYDE